MQLNESPAYAIYLKNIGFQSAQVPRKEIEFYQKPTPVQSAFVAFDLDYCSSTLHEFPLL